MITNRDDDYLICKHYYNNLDKVSEDYKDFITFQHKDNHYFAWIHDGRVVLRSEAYPDYERTIRGIKAIIKNRDIEDRYSIDSQFGVHFLCLWGGGKNNKHTGNMGEHNEIGRSCPAKTKEALYSLLRFKGDGFASAVTGYGVAPIGGKKKAVAAVASSAIVASVASQAPIEKEMTPTVTYSSTKANESKVTSSNPDKGFNWLWLLIPLLLLAAFFLFKGCGNDRSTTKVPSHKNAEMEVSKVNSAADVVETNFESESEGSVSAAQKAIDEEVRVKATAQVKADVEAQEKVDAANAKALEEAKVKAEEKDKRDADRKAKTGGSVTQENIRIGNKNSGF